MNASVLSIASFNVNGVRSLTKALSLSDLCKSLNGVDILALQETKLSSGDNEDRQKLVLSLPGYEGFFNTSSARAGYSGVAVFAKEGLVHGCKDWFDDEECPCEHCLELKKEGRFLLLEFSSFVLINVYCPNGGKEKNPDIPLKSEFLRRLKNTVKQHQALGRTVVLVGDLNVISQKIDIWYDLQDYQKAVKQGEPCMSQKVADWLQSMLDTLENGGLGMIDSFRALHPDQVKFSWFDAKTSGRESGKGWRLDYGLVSGGLCGSILEADIIHSVRQSDHCPIILRLDLQTASRPANAPAPNLCISSKTTKMQKSILSFFGGPSDAKKAKKG